MRGQVQTLLLRVATWLMGLATRVGKRRVEPEQAHALLAAAAAQAIDDAEQLGHHPPVTATSDRVGRADPGEPFEVPEGYVAMTARAQLSPLFGNALLLVDEAGRRFVPIFVGATEALAFRSRLQNEPYPRPLTHDLFDTMLAKLGARVVGVQIDELRGGVFYARLWIEHGDGDRLELDARPSDAIVLAMGAAAPVLVAEAVLDEAGRRFDGSEPGLAESGDGPRDAAEPPE
ncbi:MAG: bifunctional nuclease family protein [Deltaproteobacteria bacterium]|jgi:bifunctional DNase/RNase|nr:bifunctional nuclease family protein [Deltaproteobacteria bacterium]MBW2530279.1 bifunctional nuclease family protein [Deltaproteobacteria bacterium]